MITKHVGCTVITGEHTQLFAMLAIISGLKLRLKGLRHSRNMEMIGAKAMLEKHNIKPERTAKRLLEQMEALKIDKFPLMPAAQQTPTETDHAN